MLQSQRQGHKESSNVSKKTLSYLHRETDQDRVRDTTRRIKKLEAQRAEAAIELAELKNK
jgi:hypothetical protein